MHIPYRLVRSNRHTLALMVDSEGALIARAPRRMPQSQIEAFIIQKERWIAKRQKIAAEHARACQPLTLEEGSSLPYLGRQLTLRYGALPFAIDYHGALLLPHWDNPHRQIRLWLAHRAPETLTPLVNNWANKTGLLPSRVSYGFAKTRWGSMTPTGALRLNATLLLCPMECVEYVIVHELAHLAHPDHSPAFHALVRRILPDADARHARLGMYSGYLTLFDSAREREAL